MKKKKARLCWRVTLQQDKDPKPTAKLPQKGLRDNSVNAPLKLWLEASPASLKGLVSTHGAHPTRCVVMMNCVRQDIETNGGC